MFDTTVRASWKSLLAGGAVMTLAVAVLPPAAIAGAANCEVWNATTGGSSSSDLQQMIDTASAGDVLEVQGVCVGGFAIDKSLTIQNRSDRQPAVLDANQASTVLTVTGLRHRRISLRLQGLTVRDGRGDYGGGISAQFTDLRINRTTIRDSLSTFAYAGGGLWARRGDISLTNSVVRDNRARHGWGGGIAFSGKLRVSGSSFIGGNLAKSGGGISGIPGGSRVTLEDRAHVTRNESLAGGGGILAEKVILRDRASVRENFALGSGQAAGGGIYCHGRVEMSGHASVVKNVSLGMGGGIYTSGLDRRTIRMRGQARITDNMAARGAGVYLSAWSTLHLRQSAKVVDNTARTDSSCSALCRSRGGGVYAAAEGQYHAHIVVADDAAIVHNRPDNVFRERG